MLPLPIAPSCRRTACRVTSPFPQTVTPGCPLFPNASLQASLSGHLPPGELLSCDPLTCEIHIRTYSSGVTSWQEWGSVPKSAITPRSPRTNFPLETRPVSWPRRHSRSEARTAQGTGASSPPPSPRAEPQRGQDFLVFWLVGWFLRGCLLLPAAHGCLPDVDVHLGAGGKGRCSLGLFEGHLCSLGQVPRPLHGGSPPRQCFVMAEQSHRWAPFTHRTS